MRQRLRGLFPILLIALMVQMFAPIGAAWTAAIAASDPLRGLEICHSESGSAPADDDHGGRHVHEVCVLCCAAQAGTALDAPQPAIFAVPILEARRVIWHAGAFVLTASRIGSNAKARAPPMSV
ncbi:MAG: DUF2946 domain-containing protein [Bradyrhizobium sp.]|jgi:hypothetical protein|uniref:DUF2946 family protein n=1 Tax=Bradyrhizobium sp. TaxID=376 RepID=UPI003C7A419C